MRTRVAAAVLGFAVVVGSSLVQPSVAAQARPPRGQPVRAAQALRPPACTTKVARAPRLRGTQPSTVRFPGFPFDVVVAPHGQYAVASVAASFGPRGSASELAVLRLGSGAPRLVRAFRLPRSLPPLGLAISRNGKYLAVAASGGTASGGTAVLSLPALLAGRPHALLGILRDRDFGAIEATFSASGRFLFVSDEGSSVISVFNLARALRAGFSAPGVAVGKVPLGFSVVGSALSPNGRLLYVTSEASRHNFNQGLLQVISVARAERDPAASVVTRVFAGCQPVRVALSAHGSLAWVTARGSDALLAFSTARLSRDPSRALAAVVRVGPQPVGVLMIDHGRYALTANSARFTAPFKPQTVSVVSTAAALAGRPALVGTVPAGAFPREFGYDPETCAVLLTNFYSRTIEQFTVPTIADGRCLADPRQSSPRSHPRVR
jgi:hypothetical protein